MPIYLRSAEKKFDREKKTKSHTVSYPITKKQKQNHHHAPGVVNNTPTEPPTHPPTNVHKHTRTRTRTQVKHTRTHARKTQTLFRMKNLSFMLAESTSGVQCTLFESTRGSLIGYLAASVSSNACSPRHPTIVRGRHRELRASKRQSVDLNSWVVTAFRYTHFSCVVFTCCTVGYYVHTQK